MADGACSARPISAASPAAESLEDMMIPARSFAVERARLSVAVRYALDPGQDAEESPARLAGMLSCSASWLAATSCAADHCPNPAERGTPVMIPIQS